MGAAGDRKYKQARAWRMLRNEPMSACALGARLGITTTAANHLLLRMRRDGFAAQEAKRRNQVWVAVGTTAPEDMRGTSVGSVATLMWTISKRKSRRDTGEGVYRGREDAPKEAPPIPSLARLLLG